MGALVRPQYDFKIARLAVLPVLAGIWSVEMQIVPAFTALALATLWLLFRCRNGCDILLALTAAACIPAYALVREQPQKQVASASVAHGDYVAAEVVAMTPTSTGQTWLQLRTLAAPQWFPLCFQGNVVGDPTAFAYGMRLWLFVEPAQKVNACPFLRFTVEPSAQLLEPENITMPAADTERALLRALTIGERPSGLAMREALAPLTISGLGHILSISGLHMTLAAVLTFQLLRVFCRLAPWRLLRQPFWLNNARLLPWLLTLPLCLAFVAFVGKPAPALRALMMLVIFAAVRLAAKRHIGFDQMLLLAAVLCMLFFPAQTASLSFALSISAMCWFAPLAILPKPLLFAGGIILPWLGAWPLVASFGAGNAVGPLANLVGVPLFSAWVFPSAWLCFLAESAGLHRLSAFFMDAFSYGLWLLFSWAAWCIRWADVDSRASAPLLWSNSLYAAWGLLPIALTLIVQRWRFARGGKLT